ncbi:MAG: AAA family ATPase, partial [Polyangiaceae bacterium]|nr:AAA family ATPase [Polyangiaceae bacterium]
MSPDSQDNPRIVAPIHTVHIENFRGIRDLTVDLDPNVTVFFGKNASGKTSILDAIAIGLGAIVERTVDERPVSLDSNDIHQRWTSTNHESPDNAEPTPPVLADWMEMAMPKPKPARPILLKEPYARVRLDSASCSWDVTTLRSPTDAPQHPSIGTKNLNAIIDPVIRSIYNSGTMVSNAKRPFVLVAAYGTDRSIAKLPDRQVDFNQDFPRFGAIHDSLCSTTNYKSICEWFVATEREQHQERMQRRSFGYRHPPLEWVRRAIHNAGLRCKNPRIETKPIRLMVDFDLENGSWLPTDIASMSDGYRTHFALVVDIARRMVQLNPSDDLDSPNLGTNSEAIILIDEVELHMHPIWQGTVVNGLRRAFPRAQFVLSTNSEQVIGSLMKSSVRRLAQID